MNLDQAAGADLAGIYRAFIADTSRLPYGPADLGHAGQCDHDGGCRQRAVAAVISASHADCICGGGCGRVPASLAFLCGDHVAVEPIATKDAAEYRAADVEGYEARAVWKALLSVFPEPMSLPGVEGNAPANPDRFDPDALWHDEQATILRVVAANLDGSDKPCRYCDPCTCGGEGCAEGGHNQGVVTTGIRSPRWGEWETCASCAMAQLAALHGMPAADTGHRRSVEQAERETRHLAALLDPGAVAGIDSKDHA